MRKILIATIIAILASSCQTQQLLSEKNATSKALLLKADKRVSYFIYDNTTNKTYTLSEPPPDAILERATKIANEVAVKNPTSSEVTAKQQVELANKVIELGERTVAVNILRDALFRLSEMNINNRNQALGNDYKVLFDSILSVTKQIALADLKKQEAKLQEAKSETIKQEVELKMLNTNLDAKTNYQNSLNYLLEKDLDNGKSMFKSMYEKYPEHFNIDEINAFLKKYESNTMNDKKWKEIYDFLKEHVWKMDENLQKEIRKKAKNE